MELQKELKNKYNVGDRVKIHNQLFTNYEGIATIFEVLPTYFQDEIAYNVRLEPKPGENLLVTRITIKEAAIVERLTSSEVGSATNPESPTHLFGSDPHKDVLFR